MPPNVEPTNFSRSSFRRRIEKPWGWELLWTAEGLPYAGKLLHLNGGARTSLQVHDQKNESWLLLRGRAKVIWENDSGELVDLELQPGQGYNCCEGRRHRLIGITDCEIVEVSTPEQGTTWRLDDDYNRPHETPLLRSVERDGTGLSN